MSTEVLDEDETVSTRSKETSASDRSQGMSKVNVAEQLKIFLRIKPEEDNHHSVVPIFKVTDSNMLLVTAPESEDIRPTLGIQLNHKFTFTKIFEPEVSQEEFFKRSVLSFIHEFIEGKNHLVFSYGTTNSGKTYTIQGSSTDIGVMPRTLTVIFNHIGKQLAKKIGLKPVHFSSTVAITEKEWNLEQQTKRSVLQLRHELEEKNFYQSFFKYPVKSTESLLTTSPETSIEKDSAEPVGSQLEQKMQENQTESDKSVFSVWVSFAEIYNESIFDLLVKLPLRKSRRTSLKLADENKGKVYIKGLREICISSAVEASEILQAGRANLHFAATTLNHNSSRSHCIFTIKLLRRDRKSSGDPHTHVSVLSFCDLAGSERASKTGNVGIRLKEAGNINSSLMVLGRCISALRKKMISKDLKSVVPFRESKLTRIFQNFFMGGRASMIVNICQSPMLYEESLRVLKFSAMAKEVVTTYPPSHYEKKKKRASRMSMLLQSNDSRLSHPLLTHSKRFSCSLYSTQHLFLEVDKASHEEVQEELLGLYNYIDRLKSQLKNEKADKEALETMLDEFHHVFKNNDGDLYKRLMENGKLAARVANSENETNRHSVVNGRKRMCWDSSINKEKLVPESLHNSELVKTQEQEKIISKLQGEMSLQSNELNVMKETFQIAYEKSNELQSKNSQLQFQLANLQQLHDDLQKMMDDLLFEKQEDKEHAVNGMVNMLQDKNEEIMILCEKNSELHSICAKCNEELTKSSEKVEYLEGKVLVQEETIKDLQNDLALQEELFQTNTDREIELTNIIQEMQQQQFKREQQNQITKDMLKKKEAELRTITKEMAHLMGKRISDQEEFKQEKLLLESQFEMFQKERDKYTNQMEHLRNVIKEQNSTILDLQCELFDSSSQQDAVIILQEAIEDKNKQILHLEERNRDLESKFYIYDKNRKKILTKKEVEVIRIQEQLRKERKKISLQYKKIENFTNRLADDTEEILHQKLHENQEELQFQKKFAKGNKLGHVSTAKDASESPSEDQAEESATQVRKFRKPSTRKKSQRPAKNCLNELTRKCLDENSYITFRSNKKAQKTPLRDICEDNVVIANQTQTSKIVENPPCTLTASDANTCELQPKTAEPQRKLRSRSKMTSTT